MEPSIAQNEEPSGDRLWPVVVVGAGPAGLATSYELRRRGIDHVVLERGDRPGFVWANLYDSLTLHTGRHLSGLPGMKIPRSVPLFAPRPDFLAYLKAYGEKFALPILTGIAVTHAERTGGEWQLTTRRGIFRARVLVVATGIVSSPRLPEIVGSAEFSGQILHSSAYRRPGDVIGRRVLVLGAGNSGAEIASELARAGKEVDIAVRSGVNVVPRELFGIPIQYLSYWLLKCPRPVQLGVVALVRRFVAWRRGPSPLPPASVGPLDAIPIIGFNLLDAIQAGRVKVRPGLCVLTLDGAVFNDGSAGDYDCVLLATGYSAALGLLGGLVQRDAKGFARRADRVTSADQSGLFFVGHNYDATGGLANIARDAGLAAAGAQDALSTGQGDSRRLGR